MRVSDDKGITADSRLSDNLERPAIEIDGDDVDMPNMVISPVQNLKGK